MYKRDWSFRMNVMKQIFEIRSCREILTNDIDNQYQQNWTDDSTGE